jgi:putative transcriptional regulator
MSRQNHILSLAFSAFAAFAAIPAWHGTAQAADSGGPMMLVAKRTVQDPMYGSSVLLVTHMAGGGHIGFIVNKPTPVKVAQAFPDHQPSNAGESLFLGGPVIHNVLFAVVNRRDSPGGDSLQLAPDLFVAAGADTVKGILEKEPEHARFIVGAVVWEPGELAAEVLAGAWYTMEPDSELLLRRQTDRLYEDAVNRAERLASTI